MGNHSEYLDYSSESDYDDLHFRTFSKQVGKRTGKPTILNTLTIAGVCSESKEGGLNFSYF